jgi:hypothetical protein
MAGLLDQQGGVGGLLGGLADAFSPGRVLMRNEAEDKRIRRLMVLKQLEELDAKNRTNQDFMSRLPGMLPGAGGAPPSVSPVPPSGPGGPPDAGSQTPAQPTMPGVAQPNPSNRLNEFGRFLANPHLGEGPRKIVGDLFTRELDSVQAPESAIKELRKELQDVPSYKKLANSAPVYQSMVGAAERNTRASDVNLIYGLAKIMDPDSAVREAEMTIAQAIARLPDYIQTTIASQIQGTGRLSQEVRRGIMEEAYSRVGAYHAMFQNDAQQFSRIAQRRRMNVDDVIPKFGELKEWKPAAGPGSAATQEGGAVGGIQDGVTATNPKTGQKIMFKGGRWVPAQGM